MAVGGDRHECFVLKKGTEPFSGMRSAPLGVLGGGGG